MKEETQVELLKLTAQIITDLERNQSSRLPAIENKAEAAAIEGGAALGYEALFSYLFEYLRTLLVADKPL